MRRRNIMKRAILRRFVVFLRGDEGSFSGIMTEFDGEIYVFEQCQSVPTKEGETPIPYKGRVLVKWELVKYLVDA